MINQVTFIWFYDWHFVTGSINVNIKAMNFVLPSCKLYMSRQCMTIEGIFWWQLVRCNCGEIFHRRIWGLRIRSGEKMRMGCCETLGNWFLRDYSRLWTRSGGRLYCMSWWWTPYNYGNHSGVNVDKWFRCEDHTTWLPDEWDRRGTGVSLSDNYWCSWWGWSYNWMMDWNSSGSWVEDCSWICGSWRVLMEMRFVKWSWGCCD